MKCEEVYSVVVVYFRGKRLLISLELTPGFIINKRNEEEIR